jgi:hypothetical protein
MSAASTIKHKSTRALAHARASAFVATAKSCYKNRIIMTKKIEHPWEDSLLERKLESYKDSDFLKTFVAFANSVRPEETAIVLLGEDDNGNAKGITNPDSFQMKIRNIIEKIYPAIVWHQEIYQKDGKTCVRVEIKFSGETPHFGGASWIRKGSETVKATDEIFQKLVELRLDKVRELSKWLNKEVTIWGEQSTVPKSRQLEDSFFGGGIQTFIHRWKWEEVATLNFVNRFWVTLEKDNGEKISEPLEKLTLTFDDKNKRLKIIISY